MQLRSLLHTSLTTPTTENKKIKFTPCRKNCTCVVQSHIALLELVVEGTEI